MHVFGFQFPQSVFAGDERPTLIAWFCIARLHYNMLHNHPHDSIRSLAKSLMYYRKVTEECDRHRSYAELMSKELTACREMAVLLAAKLDRMKSQHNYEMGS